MYDGLKDVTGSYWVRMIFSCVLCDLCRVKIVKLVGLYGVRQYVTVVLCLSMLYDGLKDVTGLY